ncbi:PHP domain-containing protein [Streptacidiphilus sp. PAMC 29251]
MIPSDNHVHTEWSWDALSGSMAESCREAVALGIRSMAFTEHTDFTAWTLPEDAIADLPLEYQAMVGTDGRLRPPPFDVEGYLDCIQRCRFLFPDLRIITGVELGEPHWHAAAVGDLLASADFERVLGSLHSLETAGERFVVDRLYGQDSPSEVVRRYLAEVVRMVERSDDFAVLGHIDYPLRAWPEDAGPCRPELFEDEFRTALRALARSGRTLEVNTSLTPYLSIVQWWSECGGDSICFGSDAHEPHQVGRNFARAAGLVESVGFRRGRDDHDFWIR